MINLFNPIIGINLIVKYHDLLLQLLKRNIDARYRGSFMGLIWSFVYPLMMLAVYSFVFGVVFKSRWGGAVLAENSASFPLIMFCGMAVFNIFSESITSSPSIIINNQSYVKKVIFPLEILVLSNVLTSFFFGMSWFVLLLMGIFIFLNGVSWTMFLLPFMLVPLLLLSSGVGLFVASLGVYLRDIQQLVVILTQILFFMTPIFYPISVVPEYLRWILEINPLSPIVEETRKILIYNTLPDVFVCLFLYVFSIVIFQLGLAWFIKTKKGFADVL